jgi:hypothetical protein
MMNKPSAMQRPPVMQSLLESIEHEAGMFAKHASRRCAGRRYR